MSARGVPVVLLEGDPAFYSRLGSVAGAALGFRAPSLRIPAAAFRLRADRDRPGPPHWVWRP